jgi:ketosteroid isomerase-like protein
MATSSATQLAGTLHRAIEQCNLDMIMNCYADDAELQVVDRDHPPSRPLEFHGKQSIAGYFRDICSRPLTHKIEQEVIGGNQLAFTEACEYPDGSRVLATEMFELSDGKVSRQVTVQAWDG